MTVSGGSYLPPRKRGDLDQFIADERLGESGLQPFIYAQNPWFQAKMSEIYRFSHQLSASNSLDALLREIVREAKEILQASFSRLLLAYPKGKWFCEASYPDLPRTGGQESDLTNFVYQQAAEKSGPTYIQRGSSFWARLERHSPQTRQASGLYLFPLTFKCETLGILVLGHKEKNGLASFDEEKRQLGLYIAEQSAGAIYRVLTARRLQENQAEMVQALSKTVEARDDDTGGHSSRMTRLAERIAAACHCTDEEIQIIRWAGQLHDIGKIGIPDAILRKPGPLTDGEWAVVRKHPDVGADIVLMVSNLAGVAELIRAHHERYDGNGYPRRLNTAQIPLGARILAIADAYTAMTDGRAYRKEFTHEAAIAEIKQCAGTNFDPWIVEAFLSLYQ
jgi:HD-GYP domain-containing protein (c-di-GMP phosphodiesterase class II)